MEHPGGEGQVRRTGGGIAFNRLETRIAAGYRRLAPHYDTTRAWWADHRLGAAEAYLEREVLPRYLPPGGVVLDLGCGTGANLARLRRLGITFARYVGVDLSPHMIEQARHKFAHIPRAEFYLGNVLCLPFAPNTFDFALATWSLEHHVPVNLAVAEARQVIKDGSYLVLITHSLPAWPWGLPVRLLEPLLGFSLGVRFLRPRDFASLPPPIARVTFAHGLHTLLLLRKEPRS